MIHLFSSNGMTTRLSLSSLPVFRVEVLIIHYSRGHYSIVRNSIIDLKIVYIVKVIK